MKGRAGMATERDCYGGMFPDLDRLEANQPLEGRAFTVAYTQHGFGVQGRSLTVKPDEWRECTACPNYRQCYDLSMAKLALRQALLDSIG